MSRMLRMAERTGVGWRVWLAFFLAVFLLFAYVWLTWPVRSWLSAKAHACWTCPVFAVATNTSLLLFYFISFFFSNHAPHLPSERHEPIEPNKLLMNSLLISLMIDKRACLLDYVPTLQRPPLFLLLGFLISTILASKDGCVESWPRSSIFGLFSFLFFLSIYTSSFRSCFLYWGCGSSIRYLLSWWFMWGLQAVVLCLVRPSFFSVIFWMCIIAVWWWI